MNTYCQFLVAEDLFGEGIGYVEYDAANEPRRQVNEYAGLLLYAWYDDAGLHGTCFLSDQRLTGTVSAAEQSEQATFEAKWQQALRHDDVRLAIGNRAQLTAADVRAIRSALRLD